jgi:hypothetical protein
MKTAPDPGWIPFLKIIFGFSLLVILGILAAIIAMGKVEQSTSFGLTYILGGLTALAGGFTQWAFGDPKRDDAAKPTEEP